ncbi:hypothetical protein BOX15_Mlig021649g3 [Macrostomum lignano]|uniref:Cadherin domain-containing protein n=1 Tax=Macrostomum lignano TaxID=282301 RepID=A0A267H0S4_9PLAT|nr:hypothetical protein BOX15_Mlig021649g3 [Macrostomum lignano]
MHRLSTLFSLLLLVAMATSASSAASTVDFSIPEESPPNTLVGRLAPLPDGSASQFVTRDEYFSVAPDSGQLSVRGRIDRDGDAANLCNYRATSAAAADSAEPACVHELMVSRNLADFIPVRIRIADINDNKPDWPAGALPLRVAFAENARIGAQQTVSPGAVDLDAGENSVRRYRLVPDSTTFKLEVSGGGVGAGPPVPRLVLRQQLDRESVSGYNFTLVAEDGGGLSGSAQLLVEVLDVNDEAPHFRQAEYNASVPEDAPGGHEVLRLWADDRDAGDNGRVTYSLAPEHQVLVGPVLSIEPDTGRVLVRSPSSLDFESRKRFEFAVLARDSGAEPKEARANVVVNVIDVNDHRPQIQLMTLQPSPTSRVPVPENIRNATVASLLVSDRDAGQAGEFSCRLTAAEEFFSLAKLKALEGQVLYRLATQSPLDREAAPVLQPVVSCADDGRPSLTGSLTVTVELQDENDNPPVFPNGAKRFSPRIFENNSPGAEVLDLGAEDRDAPENARLRYSIDWPVAYAEPSPFEIDAQGILRARIPLDRERHPAGFAFRVVVTDGRFNATAVVSVRIEDVNDNPPVFGSSTYTFHVREDEKSGGVFVGELNATDADEHRNAELKFRLHPDDSDAPFQLQGKGTLFTSRAIDRETAASHTFRVIAVDSGQPEMTATATVTVNVDDVNDCDPVFEYPPPASERPAVVRLSYRELPDFQFAQVRATDRDTGDNGRLKYSLQEGNLFNWFRIDQDTGRLYVRRAMSRTELGVVRLTVKASDGGSPSRSATGQLSVRIEDSPATGLLKDAWTADMETNKLIIVCIVVATGVICAALITAICLMARRKPCAPAHVNHELVRLKSGGGGGGGGGVSRPMSPGGQGCSLPLVDNCGGGCGGGGGHGSHGGGGGGGGHGSIRDYDHRFGQRKLDSFMQPASVKQLIDDQSDGVPESDGDSGKGGSVSNSNGHRQHPLPTASIGAASLLSSAELSHAAASAATLSFSPAGGRHQPDLCSVAAGNHGNRSATLSRHQLGHLHHSGVASAAAGGGFQTLGAQRPRPHMIMEDTGGSLV